MVFWLEDVIEEKVLSKNILREVVLYISPDGMDVVCIVLLVDKLHYEVVSVDSVIMPSFSVDRTSPGEVKFLEAT